MPNTTHTINERSSVISFLDSVDRFISLICRSVVLVTGITLLVSIIIGVIANGSVALIALILVMVLAWNYLKLLLEAAERYVVLGVLVFTAPLAFAMGAARGTNNIFKSWCRMFGGQLLLLIMNAWCLKLFVNMVGEFLANPLSL